MTTSIKMSSKLGRKGDPRMHKAVAARLANPNLSLYDALLVGGFDYSANDDKSILDSKNVTLGQRKNQLSRRLRLTRNQACGGKKNSRNITKTEEPSNAIDATGKILINNNTNSNEAQAQGSNLNDESNTTHSITASNRAALDFANNLVTGGYNSINNGNNDAIGNRQCKKPRLNNYLQNISFDRTCTMATVTNQELNNNNGINHRLHQEWQLGNVPIVGENNTSTVIAAAGSLTQASFPSDPFFNSQISNRISDQPVQQYQSGTSAMALSSLSSSAQKVGLTLDQLALTLSSNSTTLAKLVADSRSGESMAKQEQLALDIYKVEVKSLYSKCLLIAGVDASLAEQTTPTYTRFAAKAWTSEGKRLRSLNDTIFGGKRMNASVESVVQGQNIYSEIDAHNTTNAGTQPDKNCTTADNVVASQNSNGHNHNRDHNQHSTGSEFGNNHAVAGNRNDHEIATEIEHDSAKCDARHMHRIGECGHKAIIHQPKDGTAPHIDFIVNDQVECYSGQDSMSFTGGSLDSAWPSKYRCKEVEESSCAKACGKNVPGKFDNGWGHLEPLVPQPKIFKLSEIDTEDPEWAFDTNDDVDGGVLGLFKLGRDSFT